MPGSTVANTRVNGSEAVRQKLLAAPKKLRAAARSATGKAGRIVAKGIKERVPRRTGALAKAVGSKTVARKKGDGYVSIAGPRRDSDKAIERSVAAVAAGKRKKAITRRFARLAKYHGREFKIDPARYAHLANKGRKAVAPTKKKAMSFHDRPAVVRGAKAATGSRFMERAEQATRGQVRDVVETTLAEAAKKLGR